MKSAVMTTWGPLALVWLVYAVISADQVMLPNATRYLVVDLGTSVGSVRMVLALFSTVAASIYLAAGKLGDRHGRRRVLRVGIVSLAAGATTVVFAPAASILFVGWSLLKGVGFGLALPNLFAVLAECYEGRRRGVAFAAFATAGSAGATMGPIVMGWAATVVSWRIAFAGDVLVLAICFALTRTVPAAVSGRHARLDWIGFALSATTIGMLILGASLVGQLGWVRATHPITVFGSPVSTGGYSVVPFFLLAAVVAAVALWLHLSRLVREGREPLFRPRLFRNRQFVTGVFMLAILLYLLASTIFVVPVFLQTVLGFDAVQSGRVTLAFTATIMAGGALSAWLARRIRIRVLARLAIPLIGAGFAALYLAIAAGSSVGALYASMAVAGFGVGVVFAQAPNAAMSAVAPEERGEAGGLNAVGEEVGVGLGVAITGSIFLGLGGDAIAMQRTLLVMIAVVAVHFLVATRLPKL